MGEWRAGLSRRAERGTMHIQDSDLVVSICPHKFRKATIDLLFHRAKERRRIQHILEVNGRITVNELSRRTNLSTARIHKHIRWAIERGLARLEPPNLDPFVPPKSKLELSE